ncbi:MAG: hypothetical protein HY902_07700 [Deltaproteobacteria bacterium]|nr:hypothetical protein [Deltaproteobacteria bacterium]
MARVWHIAVLVALAGVAGCGASAVPPATVADASASGADSQDAGSICLQVQPNTLHFGSIGIGTAQVQQLKLCNCGTAELAVVQLALAATPGDSTEFHLQLSGLPPLPDFDAGQPASASNPLKIGAGSCQKLSVSYKPQAGGPVTGGLDTGTLLVATQDGSSAKVLLEGSHPAPEPGSWCPAQLVAVQEGDAVPTKTTLHLLSNTNWFKGGGEKYHWTAKLPAGSSAQLLPNDSVPNPVLPADVAGQYELCVTVSAPSLPGDCSACVTVEAVPDPSVVVELSWDTPAAATPTGTGPGSGADLDLHLAHPNAVGPDKDCDGAPDPWFAAKFDAFWANPKPDWGAPNSTLDNPYVGSSGASGEYATLLEPEGSAANPVAYSVGVHYWKDNGFGPSNATVRIYVQGSLAASFDKVKLVQNDLWFVGKLWWPDSVDGSKPLFQACFQGGSSCAAKQNRMWQPKGDWCIAK